MAEQAEAAAIAAQQLAQDRDRVAARLLQVQEHLGHARAELRRRDAEAANHQRALADLTESRRTISNVALFEAAHRDDGNLVQQLLGFGADVRALNGYEV
eukprot:TRINITY_DN6025_c0_g1_i2.p1 TRINITY_DN6025_c0_g1~~TRINITY_DN6025_c0_g1_i2.p1  ORF type:complete len:112 (-),score=27.83 TRINITY_DN6025_c0_g1_i2:576-875(-)